jgi:hypothetical protein
MTLVALLDVLEHVTDDKGFAGCEFRTAEAWRRAVGDGSDQSWMWSAHDVAHHHHRRYRKHEIRKLALDAGYEIDMLSPFNSLLFPPIAAVRLVGKLTGKDDSDDALPSAPVNKALDTIFGLKEALSAGCLYRSECL